MKSCLIEKLKTVSEEEQIILSEKRINKDIYTNNSEFTVDRNKFMSIGKYITVRPHVRFTAFPEHVHNYVEIMYVCSGRIVHIIDGRELEMNAGDILFMNQHVHHSIKKADIDDVAINLIVLPEFFDIPLVMIKANGENLLADFLMGTFRINEKKPQYLHFKTAHIMAIENLMENIIESLLEGKNEDNINQMTIGLVFLHLLNNIETISDKSLLSGNDILADTAIRYINLRYKDASLFELAESMHQSLPNMSKIIKNSTGCTFSQLLQKKRNEQAAVFLKDTNMSISEIINAVGYENSSHFYRLFREKYGMSPKEYRKKG